MKRKTKSFTVISSDKIVGLQDFYELFEYWDFFYILVWKDIKTRYAQSVLGIGWAILQPLVNMVIFTLIFGKLAKVGSDGVPYSIFSYVALVPWTYFSSTLSESINSLMSFSKIMSKVYFPRLIIPIAPIFSRLIDFMISFFILFLMMFYFSFSININFIFIPFLVIIMMLTSSGLGMLLTSLAIQYRDIKYLSGFLIQILIYLAPVVYSIKLIPQDYLYFYGLFPMVGVIEGFRSILLQTNSMPWDLVFIGFISSTVLFIIGAFYFKNMEKYFADVA